LQYKKLKPPYRDEDREIKTGEIMHRDKDHEKKNNGGGKEIVE